MHLFIIVLDFVSSNLDQNKTLGFTLRKQLSRSYPAETLAVADFADDLELLSDKIKNAEKDFKDLNQTRCSKY